jgi:hypothetical protein
MAAHFGAGVMIGFGLFMGVIVAGLFGVFAYLAWRPQWWGKLLAAMCGLSWLMNGAVSLLFEHLDFSQGDPVATSMVHIFISSRPLSLTCGMVMVAIAITHQITDPRFSGPPRPGAS